VDRMEDMFDETAAAFLDICTEAVEILVFSVSACSVWVTSRQFAPRAAVGCFGRCRSDRLLVLIGRVLPVAVRARVALVAHFSLLAAQMMNVVSKFTNELFKETW
jgi:hypothetical protein